MKYSLLIISLLIIFLVSCNHEKPKPNIWKTYVDNSVKTDSIIQAKLDTSKAVVVCNPNLKEWAVMVDTLYFFSERNLNTFFDYQYIAYAKLKPLNNVWLTKNPSEYIFKDHKEAIRIRDLINNFLIKKHYDDSISNLQHHYQICKQ